MSRWQSTIATLIKRPEKWQLNYFPMWAGQALSLVGSRVVQFALVWYLAQQTGSATVLVTATFVGIVPEILLAPIAGAYVDRWDRQIVLIVADGLVALASWWLAYLFWIDSVTVWHIYVIMFIRAVGGSFHSPAIQASTSLMVPKDQLSRVNGLNQIIYGGLNIMAPPLGALLISLLPLYGVMLVDVATAIIAIVPLMFVLIPLPQGSKDISDQGSIWSDILWGLRYILNWRGLLFIVVTSMIIQVVITPAYSLLPLMVSDYFGGGVAQLGAIEAILGIGMIFSGLILSVWGGFRRRIFTTLLGLVVLGFSLMGFGLAPAEYFLIALASMFVIGLAVPLVNAPMMAIMQATVEPSIQGRVFSMMSSLILVATPIGLILAGPLSDWLHPRFWYLAAGIICVALASMLFFIPEVINIEEHQFEMDSS
jgi:DHA3 family macrolide efflux protein-like MFS transporter